MILAFSIDPDLLNAISTHLEQRGAFRVYAASSEEDALSIAAGRKVDAIVLDAEGLERPLESFTADLETIQPDARLLILPAPDRNAEPEESTIAENCVILQRPFSIHEMDAYLDEIPVRIIEPGTEDSLLFEEEALEEDYESGDLTDFLGEVELNQLNEYLGSMPSPDPETDSEEESEQEEAPTLEPSITAAWIPLENDLSESAPDLSHDIAETDRDLSESEVDVVSPTLPPLPSAPDYKEESEGIDEPEQSTPVMDEQSAEVETPEPAILDQKEYPSEIEFSPGTAPLGIKSIRFEYYCVIIPGNPEQFLARDISDRLGFILPQIHLSRGWKVTSLSIRPLFMMWRISLPTDVSPVEAIQEIRRRTTSHLYTNFPDLLPKNNQDDFWAPGYLILSGLQAPSINLINQFIQRTRSRESIQSG